MVRTVALIQPGQKKRRHCRGTGVLRLSENREVWGGEATMKGRRKPVKHSPEAGRQLWWFGQHVERTEITKVREKFLPTIFYNGFSWMCRKSQ